MATLTALDAKHGYIAGVNSVDTSGYVAVIPAFQKVYFADGRTYDNHGYHKLDFLNTKIAASAVSAAFTHGEPVVQTTSGATGSYDECTDVKVTGTFGSAHTPFMLGEKVTQAASGAIGYVVYVDEGFINVCSVERDPETGELVDFDVATDTVTGATSGATMATVSAVTAIGLGKFHYIYRTGTTEFDQDNTITGTISGSTITPHTAADNTPDDGACIQHLYPSANASAGTFTITYDGQTTAAIDFDATTGEITTALNLLSTVTAGDIVVSGTIFESGNATTPLIFTFLSTLGSVNACSVTSSMTGATTVTVKPIVTGFTTITAPPHWLTWKPVAQFSGVTNSGIMPDGGSNIGCACFGRMFLNFMFSPHLWGCTRVHYPLDFDNSQTDLAAAMYSKNSKAHEVGDAITAMISYKDHYLVWGCANEVWLLQSDPLMGGVNRCLSKSTGIFSPTSWCWDDKNNLYFMGTDGIYALSAEAIINAQPPINLTKQRNPKLITSLGLNRRTDRVAMGFDKQRYGIKVSVTQQDGAWAVAWWIDLRTGGVFPEKYPSGQEAASLFYYDSYKSSERGLLIGGYGGYIYKEDETESSDDGSNAIEAHVTLGPFVAGGEPRETIGINETSLVLGEESDGVTVDFHTGTSADEVVANVLDEETPIVTKGLTDDSLKDSIIDRVSGRAVAVKIKNETADETFSMEEINLTLQGEGRKE